MLQKQDLLNTVTSLFTEKGTGYEIKGNLRT